MAEEQNLNPVETNPSSNGENGNPQEQKTPEAPAENGGKTLLGGSDNKVSSSPESNPAEKKEGQEQKQEEPKEPDVPEKYELKFAEGVSVDEEALAEFTPVAKDLKLTNDQAQKLADVYASRMAKAAEAQRDNYMATIAKWADETKADAEFGGKNLQETIASSSRALKAYDADGAFAKLMDESGFGNHPAVIKFCARIGKELKEDTVVKGAGTTGKSAAQIMYDKSDLS